MIFRLTTDEGSINLFVLQHGRTASYVPYLLVKSWMKTPCSPRYEDPLALGSWNEGYEGLQQEGRPIASQPDICRRRISRVEHDTGPPGSAPPWVEGEDGQQLPECDQLGASTETALGRSRDVLVKAWNGIRREGSEDVSKATYVRLHIEIHRRVALIALAARLGTSLELCDLRSAAEMNWTSSNRGNATMSFEHFKNAWCGMAQGLGMMADVRKYDAFCSVASEVSSKSGVESTRAEGNHEHRSLCPESRCVGGPGRMPQGSPFRGSFTPGAGGEVPSFSDRAQKRWLLTMERPGTESEECWNEAPHSLRDAATLEGCGHGAGDGGRHTVVGTKTNGGVPPVPGGQSQKGPYGHPSWPPAWVKLKKTDAATDGTQEDPLVVAKGMFTGFVPSRASGIEPRLQTPDTRLLKGSASDRALQLQAELLSDRVRLLDLQRPPVRGGITSFMPGPTPPFAHESDQHQHSSATITTALDDEAENDADSPFLASSKFVNAGTTASPESLLSCAVLVDSPDSPHPCSGFDGSCIAISSRILTRAVLDELTGSQGSFVRSTTLRSNSRSTVARRKDALTSQRTMESNAKKPAAVLPCKLCRRRESALWCSECKAAFCIACFESVPHHQGTGLVPCLDHERGFPKVVSSSVARPLGNTGANGRSEDDGRDADASGRISDRECISTGRLRLGRSKLEYTAPSNDSAEGSCGDAPGMEMKGSKAGATKGRRMSRRESAMLLEKDACSVAILPQDELAAHRSIPALCLNSGADGVLSARDFHNNKYALAAAKAVSPRGLPLDFTKGKGRYNFCGGPLQTSDETTGGGGQRGGGGSSKMFGGISVHVVA